MFKIFSSLIGNQAIASFVNKSFPANASFQIESLKLINKVPCFNNFTFEFFTPSSVIFSFVSEIIFVFISAIEHHKFSHHQKSFSSLAGVHHNRISQTSPNFFLSHSSFAKIFSKILLFISSIFWRFFSKRFFDFSISAKIASSFSTMSFWIESGGRGISICFNKGKWRLYH